MSLSSPYLIHPLSITCDTLLVTISSHHLIQHLHCSQPKDLLPHLSIHTQKSKIVILADDYQQGQQYVSQLAFLQEKMLSGEDKEESDAEMVDHLNDLKLQMMKKIQQKTSVIRLRNIINETQQSISNLSKEILKANMQGEIRRNDRSQKGRNKQDKIKQKHLIKLLQNKKHLEKKLERQGGVKLQDDPKDQLLIDHQNEDEAFSLWEQDDKENLLIN